MNERLRPSSLPTTTQAAKGLARRRFSVAEIKRMVADGIIAEDERLELMGGELVPMSPKGNRHEVVKKGLQQHWIPLVGLLRRARPHMTCWRRRLRPISRYV
jgi:hypothetical protein